MGVGGEEEDSSGGYEVIATAIEAIPYQNRNMCNIPHTAKILKLRFQ